LAARAVLSADAGLLVLSLTVEALQGKRVKTRCYQEGVGHLEPRFQYFLVSIKLDTLLSKSANCTVLRTVVLTQYRRVTDGQTDRQTDLL